MAEAGVLYTCPDEFLERLPSLMARAGIALKELPRPEYGEGCERCFALQMSRDKGTVELSGFYFMEENRFIIDEQDGKVERAIAAIEKIGGTVRRNTVELASITAETRSCGFSFPRSAWECRLGRSASARWAKPRSWSDDA
ncbi:MAG: hypothetical protein ACHRXM_21495, partial [Isosphaerales bacterium]